MTLRHKVHTVKKVQHTHAHAHSRYTQGTTHALIEVNTYFHTHTYAPYNNDTSVLHREKKKRREAHLHDDFIRMVQGAPGEGELHHAMGQPVEQQAQETHRQKIEHPAQVVLGLVQSVANNLLKQNTKLW